MRAPTIEVGTRRIGPGEPIYLIAEVGTTCLGDLDKALALVSAGAKAGVDAVKFQVIDPDQDSDKEARYAFSAGGVKDSENMAAMFRRLQFSEDEWTRIAKACEAAGVAFFATVDYLEGVDLLDRLGAPAHKLGAWDTTFVPLIEKVAASGKPVFVDLGPTSEDEIDEMTEVFLAAGGDSLILLHDYHTDVAAEMNLRAIPYLQAKMGWPVGYSSPARDTLVDCLAVGLGAQVIEKRLILDRNERAFHADESCEPDELAEWVAAIRRLEAALGREAVVPSQNDLAGARKYYRSVCTLRPVAEGEAFDAQNLGGKRPGTGLHTRRLGEFWGRRAARALPADHLLDEGDVA